jgi:hypothetical protein
VERFAKQRGIPIRWVLDNLTPEIEVNGAELKLMFLDAYGEGDDFLARADPFLKPDLRYLIYAEDF